MTEGLTYQLCTLPWAGGARLWIAAGGGGAGLGRCGCYDGQRQGPAPAAAAILLLIRTAGSGRSGAAVRGARCRQPPPGQARLAR